MTDVKYMQLALQLAEKGCGHVNPNPMVGAVIVKDGQVIGKGYHEKYGKAHAEPNALADCQKDVRGAELYVTLEPCCHHGKTPPCTDAIIQSGIRRVIVGAGDPNPVVAGKGIQKLRANGIEVAEGILAKECEKLNEVFFHYIKTKTPYVVMKYAMTMDGKIAAVTGKSKWITGEAARHKVHEDRHRYSAVMVGVGTVIADDPLLTCRISGRKNPIRVVCDTKLRTPLTSKIIQTADDVPTIIATASDDEQKHRPYIESGCSVVTVSKEKSGIDLKELMEKLGTLKIDSVFLEGGGTLNWSALQSGIVNKVQTYIAPKIFGGAKAKTPVAGSGVDCPDNAFFLSGSTIILLGNDILVESEVLPECLPES